MAKNKDSDREAVPPPPPPETQAPADADLAALRAELERLQAEAGKAHADAEKARAEAEAARQRGGVQADRERMQAEQEAARQQIQALGDYRPPVVTSGVVLTQKLRETGTRKSLAVCRQVLAKAADEGRHPTADEVIEALIAAEAPNLTIAKAKMIRAEGFWEDRPAPAAVFIEDKFAIPQA